MFKTLVRLGGNNAPARSRVFPQFSGVSIPINLGTYLRRPVLVAMACLTLMAGCVGRDPKYPDVQDIEEIDFDELMGLPRVEASQLTPRLGQNCPYPEYRNPVVMPLEIPGTVKDGYFVAAHYQYVVVRDGYWQIRDVAGWPVGLRLPGHKHCRIPK